MIQAKMSKRILLLCDFSNNSWNAIEFALTIFKEMTCEFFIVNIYGFEHFGLNGNYLLDPDKTLNGLAERRSHEDLGHVLARITFEFDHPNHKIHVMARPGPFSTTVTAVASELNADLIVLGAKGANPNCDHTFGHNAIRLMNNPGHSPLLVVPESWTSLEGTDILLLNGNPVTLRPDWIDLLLKIVEMNNATIHIKNQASRAGLKTMNQVYNSDIEQKLYEVDHCYLGFQDHPFADTRAESEHRSRWGMICFMVNKPKPFSFFQVRQTFHKDMPHLASSPTFVLQG